VKFFRRHGIRRVRRVLSDNGACYRSKAFALALGASRSRHKRTRPYRPQTNGKGRAVLADPGPTVGVHAGLVKQ
jgi:transposase InsO family protein